MEYEAIIGMEVHVELSTQSKMFCGCSAEFFGRDPNTCVCPVCMGYPGVLPVVNEQAVKHAVSVGLALNCTIAPFSKFDRKNYTYPDLPKGYQISQYDLPLCQDGWIETGKNEQPRRIRIRRAHLEEDTAKVFHVGSASMVDFNRCGVPLLEIVTEPDIRSGEEAREFLVKLRSILRYLDVSSADMEKGAMRCEPNISVRPVGSAELGVKTEIKNLNSFRSVKMAIEYEIDRQIQAIESGEGVAQVTMGWNERENRTVVQRSKETAQDYRYFPEPDLPPLELAPEFVREIGEHLPELPDAKFARFVSDYGQRPQDAQILVSEADTARYFEAAVAAARECGIDATTVCNWIIGEMFRLLRENSQTVVESSVSPQSLVSLLDLVGRRVVNSNTAKEVLAEMFRTGQEAEDLIAAQGLGQISDKDSIEPLVDGVLAEQSGPVAQYLAGKTSVIGYLIGQVMRASRGKADPQLVRSILNERLERLGE